MDKEQIKEEIEKKLYKWGLTLVLSNLSIIVIAFLILDEIIPSDIIVLSMIAILNILSLFSLWILLIYVYNFIDERYDKFLERKQYWKKTSLKDKILDFLIIFWVISPIIAAIILTRLMSEPLKAIIFGISFVIFWLITPLILAKEDEKT